MNEAGIQRTGNTSIFPQDKNWIHFQNCINAWHLTCNGNPLHVLKKVLMKCFWTCKLDIFNLFWLGSADIQFFPIICITITLIPHANTSDWITLFGSHVNS